MVQAGKLMLIPGKLYQPTLTVTFSATLDCAYWYNTSIEIKENDIFLLVKWDNLIGRADDILITILFNGKFLYRRSKDCYINRWFSGAL